MASCKGMEKEPEEDAEEVEELQAQLYSGLDELLFFLKKMPMNVSFKCDALRNMIKLGQGQERPRVNAYILPMASSCLPMLFAFLAEGSLPTLEDNLLCAEAAASLLSMFPSNKVSTIISHCYLQLENEKDSVVDFSVDGTMIFLRLAVAKPLSFKLCFARALLRNQHCLTPTTMVYLTDCIQTACFQYSSLTCLGFRTLNMWLSYWKKMDLCLDYKTCQNVYSIVVDNWENQVPGVRKETVKVLSGLLDVACPTTKFTVQNVTKHVVDDLSWKMKSKYFMLAMLIPRYGVLKALQHFPTIIPSLITTLGTTRLVSAGADVYRNCLTAFQDENEWCNFFLDKVISLLTSQDEKHRLSQLNFLSRWLTPTLHLFPVLMNILHDKLISLRHGNCQVHLTLSALIHQGRKEGYVQDLWPAYSFIEVCLVHGDEEVRKHAFAAVCKKTKKTKVPSTEEFEAVKKFLIENVNGDCSTLRQSLVDSFSHFLERLSASSEKQVSPENDFSCEPLMPTLTFLNWLHKYLLENLKFGGNYQRRVTSLQLYLEIMKRFGSGEEQTCDKVKYVRQIAKQQDMWLYDSEESWLLILDCILCPTEDIQKVAADIIGNHWGFLGDEEAFWRVEKLWSLTLNMCNSAIFYETESGSILMKLLVQFLFKYPHLSQIIPPPPSLVKNGQNVDVLLEAFQSLTGTLDSDSSDSLCRFEVNNDTKYQQEVDSAENTDECGTNNPDLVQFKAEQYSTNAHQALCLRPLLSYWHQELARQWLACQEDLFGAVMAGAGVHGVLGAFSHLVPYFTDADVARLLLHIGRIVDHFIDILSGHSSSSLSASFAEMMLAIEQVLPHDEDWKLSTQLSPGHQLVLSCVWLTLKQCCHLAASMLCHQEASGLNAVRCIVIVEKILLQCRYKGTIEAAGSAMAVMVRHVTSEKETRRCLPSFLPGCGEKLCDLLLDILLKVLRAVNLDSNQTSITRRSAGLGILVQKIVAFDSRPKKPFLQICLRQLFETVETPPPSKPVVVEYDLPQACALHLLSQLVQEALLRQEMLPMASAIALLCFQTFSSSIWTVRNAALQLFGVVVPLLVGEKKVHDDDTETYGNLTSEEFFAHHPFLVTFFKKEIQNCISDQNKSKNIIPILSLLSKLTFGDSWSQDNYDTEMQSLNIFLYVLLEDPELMVRRTAAKCYSRLISKNFVYKSINTFLNELEEVEQMPENTVHGYLSALHLLIYRLVDDGNVETFKDVLQNFKKLNLSKASWISRTIALDVREVLLKYCANGDDNNNEHEHMLLVRDVLDELEKYTTWNVEPAGFSSWAIKCIEFASAVCGNDELCLIWKVLYEKNLVELSNIHVSTIHYRVNSLPTSVKEEIANNLVSCICNEWTKDWNLLSSMYTTLLEIVPCVTINYSSEVIYRIFKNSVKMNNVQCWSVALPLSCVMFAPYMKNFATLPLRDQELLKMLLEETKNLSSAEECDVDERVHGAKAFVVLYQELACLYLQNGEVANVPLFVDAVSLLVDSGIAFLQDENSEVRKEASKFITPEQNPYCCLLNLLSITGLQSIFSNFHVARFLQSRLLDFSQSKSLLKRCEDKSESVMSTSLFDSGISNIYAEEAQIVYIMAQNLKDLLAQEPVWCKSLPAPQIDEDLEDLVTRFLAAKKASACARNGAAISTSDLNVLLTRLEIVALVNEKVSSCSSNEDYNKLIEQVFVAMKDC